jgi:type IV pilus assembly protein PilW
MGVILPARPAVASNNVADWMGGLDPSLLPGNPPGNPVGGSDVIVVHSTLQGTTPAYVTAIADGADRMTVNSAVGFAVGQLVAISDCTKSVTFEITGIAGNALVHSVGGPAPGNSATPLPISFAIAAQVQPVTTTVYFVGVGADGDGALFSYELNATGAINATPRELAPGVESMQILYGIDTSASGDGSVTRYVTADLVANWSRVLSVQIAVLAASPPNAVTPPGAAQTFNLLGTTVTPPRDSRRRQVFTTSIALRNTVS